MSNMQDYELGKDLEDMKKEFPYVNFNKKYTFFYDETNNCRKFSINKNKFNTNYFNNFIVGGIVLNEKQFFDKNFKEEFGLNDSLKEIKFKNIAYGSLFDCLNSEKLKKYLMFLRDNNILIHYSSLNLLYWAIVDIIDSAVYNYEDDYDRELLNSIKNSFYIVCKKNISKLKYLFTKYDYPNIKKNLIRQFIDDVLEFIQSYISSPMHFELQSLKGLLELSKEKNNLPFVVDEEDGILLRSFMWDYLRLIYLYVDSSHIIDHEFSIMQEIKNIRFLNNGEEVKNYLFIDSQENDMIQLSDIFVGLLGKIKVYFNSNDIEKIKHDFNSLNYNQISNLKLLSQILRKSEDESIIFLRNIDAIEEIDKMGFIMKIA